MSEYVARKGEGETLAYIKNVEIKNMNFRLSILMIFVTYFIIQKQKFCLRFSRSVVVLLLHYTLCFKDTFTSFGDGFLALKPGKKFIYWSLMTSFMACMFGQTQSFHFSSVEQPLIIGLYGRYSW